MRRRTSPVVLVALLMVALAAPVQAVEPQEPPTTGRSDVAPTGTPPPFPQEGSRKHARQSWIVTLRRGTKPLVEAPGLAKKAGGTVGHIYQHALNGFQFKGSATAARSLRKSPNVVSVTRDHAVYLTEIDPFGIERIDAFIVGGGDAYQAGFRGSGARIAVIDTGIDLDHPDLAASIDEASGYNCVNPALSPNDGHGHGTHVAGTAAAPLNGEGVVGVAPEATLVPIKSFDDAGNSSEALVLCGVDRVVGLMTDADPANDVDVANMSWGDPRAWGSCADDPLHGAICAAHAQGVVLVGGAGNNASDAGTFVPAAFPEVISVSAIADFDGDPGGLAGCQFIPSLLWTACDDAFAFFSNYGPSVDVTAPGVNVYSTWAGGGYQTSSGTSMATPHVAGVAALMKAANPSITPAQVETILEQTGELPDGTTPESGCSSTTQWSGDPDGIAEPLVNALRAAQRAAGSGAADLPTVAISPTDGTTVTGLVELSATASHASGIASAQFFVDDTSVGTDTSEPYSVSWDSAQVVDGSHTFTGRATSLSGLTACTEASINVGVNRQGNWVGNYGVDGYALGGWNGPGTSDLAVLPNATLTMEQGYRYSWASPTTDVRALEAPDESERRATAWYHGTSLKLRLNFTAAYTGTLHVYGFDWEGTARRMKVTVTDGTTTKTVNITTTYHDGAWMHFPISVASGGIVRVTADRTAGSNAVIAGLFLGGAGTPPQPPPPPPPPYEPGVQGNWVGNYGVDGYALGGWNGPGTSDLAVLPNATLTMEQGYRYSWASPTTDVRALEAPDESERRATAWYHGTSLKLRLNFTAAYTGTLHVYGFDWEGTARRMKVTVTDGTTTKTVNITTTYHDGAWMHFPISVASGGIVRVTADRTSSKKTSAVIAGLFLGGPGTLP
jgi:subtilisin family serine protease